VDLQLNTQNQCPAIPSDKEDSMLRFSRPQGEVLKFCDNLKLWVKCLSDVKYFLFYFQLLFLFIPLRQFNINSSSWPLVTLLLRRPFHYAISHVML
jgi:hypothetical protein